MKERFKTKTIGNVFKSQSDEDALRIVSLSLAANDLTLNAEALERFSKFENMYFFASSLSILREVAKLVANIKYTKFQEGMSANTKQLLLEVNESLASFERGSLVRDVLKPIRDFTFHYNYVDEKGEVKKFIELALSELKAQNTLKLGFEENNGTAQGQRYYYADKFRSNVLNQLLSNELISTISEVSAKIVMFVDSLLTDLNNSHEPKHRI